MSLWGHLENRYATERPRKLLALDGGGIRGIISLEILARIESELRAASGNNELVLADYFDYVGGSGRAYARPIPCDRYCD